MFTKWPKWVGVLIFVVLCLFLFVLMNSGNNPDHEQHGVDPSIADHEEMLQQSTPTTGAVISVAMGYSIETFNSFIKSLRYTSCEADIFLAVKGEILQQKEFQALFEEQNVTAIPWDVIQKETCDQQSTTKPISNEYGFHITNDTSSFICAEGITASLARYVFYEQVVEHYVESNGQIFISDFRDAFFQQDPFQHFSKYLDGAELMVFEELAAEKIGWWDTQWIEENDNYTGDPGYSHTTAWVKNCFGLDEKTTNKTVLCSGTIGGTTLGMKDYLKRFLAKVQQMRTVNERHCILSTGVDQGYHNFLVYATDWQFGVKIEKNAEGLVNTMGRSCLRYGIGKGPLKVFPLKYGVAIDQFGFALNVDTSRSTVIHQLDRCTMEGGGSYADILSSKVLPRMYAELNVTNRGREEAKGVSVNVH